MTDSRSASWIKIVQNVLLGVAVLILLYLFMVYVAYALNLFYFPFDYDQGEGFELYDVARFAQGQWPYADIETYPFYGSIYPPVYHILLVPFYWIFGAAYWYGRVFSFVSTLLSAALIGYAVYAETKRRSPSVSRRPVMVAAGIAGFIFLASNIVYHIGPLFRQHISMIFFETAAVVVFAHANEIEPPRRRRRVFLLGFALLLLAGYTKQLAAFTVIGVMAFLFIRHPRRAMIWGIGFGLITGLIFAFLTVATDGHWWTQTVTANVKDFDFAQAWGLFKLFVRTHGVLIGFSALMIVYELYFERISVYSLWLASTLTFNAISAGTWGAGDSYYATVVAALAILSGLFLARTLTRSWMFRANLYQRVLIQPLSRLSGTITGAVAILAPLGVIVYALSVFHTPTQGAVFSQVAQIFGIRDNTGYAFHDPDGYTTLAYAQIGHSLTQADIDGGERIVALIDSVPEDVRVLSEEAGFSFATGREVITNPVVLKILDDVGAYDSTELVHMIEAQVFGLVILRAQFYPVAVNIAITTYYEESERVRMNGFDYRILTPREEPLR